MSKRFEDDKELKKFLEEQIDLEADMIEKALFSDESFEDYEPTDEKLQAGYEKLMERVREMEEEKERKSRGRKPFGRRLFRHSFSLGKAAGFVVVCAVCVFAASMSIEGNRRYMVESVRYLLGDDTRVVLDNDENNEFPETDEYAAIADIENTLGVEVPEFMYRPEGFEMIQYEVDSFSGTARVEYEYNGIILVLDIDEKSRTNSSKGESVHGEDTDTIDITGEDIKVEINEIQDKEDKFPSFLSRWEREEVIYQFSGKIEKDIFYRMLKRIRY